MKNLDTNVIPYWNLNKTEIPAALIQQMGQHDQPGKNVRGHSGSSSSGSKQVRKFIQLKQMISFILDEQWSSFDRYFLFYNI